MTKSVLLVLLSVGLAWGSAIISTSSRLPYYMRFAFRQFRNGDRLLAAAESYMDNRLTMENLQMILLLSLQKKGNGVESGPIIDELPSILKELRALNGAFVDMTLTDEEFWASYQETHGTLSQPTPEKVAILDLTFFLNVYIQMVKTTADNVLDNPSGLTADQVDGTNFMDTFDQKWKLHKRACQLLYRECDVLSDEGILEKEKVVEEAKKSLRRNMATFDSLHLVQFYQTCSSFGLRPDIQAAAKTLIMSASQIQVENKGNINIDSIHVGLPVCLEIGFQVIHGLDVEQLSQMDEKIIGYQRCIIQLYIQGDPHIFKVNASLSQKVHSDICLLARQNEQVYNALAVWLLSWSSLATRGLFPLYNSAPKRPYHFSPTDHLRSYCEMTTAFFTQSLQPYMLNCFKDKVLIPQALKVFKETLEATIAIGKVITSFSVFKMQGAEVVKNVNAPVMALVKLFSKTIQDLHASL